MKRPLPGAPIASGYRFENKRLHLLFFLGLLCFLFGSFSSPSPALAGELENFITDLGNKSRTKIKKATRALGTLGNVAALPALEALRAGQLRADESGRVIVLGTMDTQAQDAITGDTLSVEGLSLRKPRINNAVRRVLALAIAKLKLNAGDADIRLAAAEELLNRSSDSVLDLVHQVLVKEKDSRVVEKLSLVLAKAQLQGDDLEERLQAIETIKNFGDSSFRPDLEGLLQSETAAVKAAASKAITSIDQRQFFINQIANLFYGLSLGSILLLAALGLAITFGLMGVINMAHGEMLMIGAYSTFVVQNLFKEYLPGLFDYYLVAAIPTAFFVSAIVGIVLERSIIRHLYGRPLETLLATWGISLVLIQSVRLIFGAQNVELANPSYLSGGVEAFHGVVLPYSRIAVIFFVIFVVISVWTLLQKTSLGLQVRSVTQNRGMASCMGIATRKVDMWTFGLGSGVAGLGGLALSQVGNVGPELGQMYIVDSFMVVVLGGVGKIAGTVAGALGIGVTSKFLEPVAGAVLGKIIVLVLIIIVIQKRPQGLFALKGRVADN
jgi:urea transport system permease protein